MVYDLELSVLQRIYINILPEISLIFVIAGGNYGKMFMFMYVPNVRLL